MCTYIHLYKTEYEFENKYYGDSYNEPWLGFTMESSGTSYNKRNILVGYIDINAFESNFLMSFDLNNDSAVNMDDVQYAAMELDYPPIVENKATYSTSLVDSLLFDNPHMVGGFKTCRQLECGDDGWTSYTIRLKLSDDANGERWCCFNIGSHMYPSYIGGDYPDKVAIYSELPPYGEIAGGYEMGA